METTTLDFAEGHAGNAVQDMAWLTCHPMGHQIPTWVRLVLPLDLPRFPAGRPVPGGGIPGHMPLGHPVHPCPGLHLR